MVLSESRKPRVFAIVPAAGRSRRMGTAKQLLRVGDRTMLQAVLEPLAGAAIEGVALVTYTAVADAVGHALPPGTFIVINDDPTSEMIDSIRRGLSAWMERVPVEDRDGILVCPADQPGIASADFDRCVQAFAQSPEHVVIAAHAGRRGHPIIFPSSLAAFVQSAACDGGLNSLPAAYADRVRVVPCVSPAVVRDIDRPADRQPRDGQDGI